MYLHRCALWGSFLITASFTLGCSDNPKGMQNMQLGTGPAVQKDMPLKKGKKPMPADPATPKPPP